MLVMTTVQLDDVYGHGAEGYPYECCGLLLGTPEADGRQIVRAIRRARNANTERTRDRYEVHPEDFAASDREAERNGWEILGCYHSHPRSPNHRLGHRSRAWLGRRFRLLDRLYRPR